MKKVLILSFLLIIISQIATAQSGSRITANPDADTVARVNKPLSLLNTSIWRLRALGIGIEHERMIGRKTSFVAAAKLSSFHSSRLVGFPPSLVVGYTVNPSVSVAGRYYYNLEKRAETGKFVRHNSGNYLMARAVYIFPYISESDRDVTDLLPGSRAGVELFWGFQRTYRDGFYLNLALGGGLATYYSGFRSQFTLGYVLP